MSKGRTEILACPVNGEDGGGGGAHTGIGVP
jgi:hypothetical protein